MKGDATDPRALIREAYRIDGITDAQCRSVFLDWAMGVPVEQDTHAMIRFLLGQYEADAPDHPMTRVLRDGLLPPSTPRRRGGWRGRLRPDRAAIH